MISVESLINALKNSDLELCHSAARSLGIESLIDTLRHPDSEVRQSSAIVLGELGDKQAVEPLIQSLKENTWVCQTADPIWGEMDDERGLPWTATEALVKLGELALSPLLNALADENKGVRFHAVGTLGKLGDARATLPLIEALKDSDFDVRRSAAQTLGELGDKAVAPLIQVLKDEDEWVRAGDGYDWVRAAATFALGQLGDVRAIGPLIEALKDSQGNYRPEAVRALSNFSHPRVVELFIQILKGWEHFWDYRHEAMLVNIAGFLGKMGDKRAIDPLIKSLNYSNEFRCGFAIGNDARENGGYVPIFAGLKVNKTRLAVVEALNKLTGSSAVELLFNILRQPNHPLRPDAAKALGNLGELSQLRLINALKDEDSFVRQSAAEALGNIGDEQAVPALIEALGDGDDKVRLSAIESLRWIDNKEAVEPLMPQLRDSNWQVREAAIRALGRLRDDRAIKPLTDMLKDENSQVREQAVSALGKFEGNQDVELIIELLKDGDCKVRRETASMLGQVGDVRAVEPLSSALLNDSDLLVREFAVEALNKFGDARAIAPLTSVLNDRDPNIGYAARDVIESIRNRNLL